MKRLNRVYRVRIKSRHFSDFARDYIVETRAAHGTAERKAMQLAVEDGVVRPFCDSLEILNADDLIRHKLADDERRDKERELSELSRLKAKYETLKGGGE